MKFPTRILPALLLGTISQLQVAVKAGPVAAAPTVTADRVIGCDLIIPGPPVIASTPGNPVTGLELSHNGNTAILTGEGFNTRISFTDGGLGFFDRCHEWWLNVGTSSTSLKPLLFGFDDEETTTWVASLGSDLKSSDPPTATFLACNENGQWELFLQTGDDVPPYSDCIETVLSIGINGPL